MQLNAHCSPHTAHKTRQDLFYTMLKILTWINTLRYTININKQYDQQNILSNDD